MEWIVGWARQIAVYLIFTSLLTKLLKKESQRNELRLISGILLILLLAKPLFSLLHQEDNYMFHLKRYLMAAEVTEESMLEGFGRLRDDMVKNKLEEAIKNRLGEIASSFSLSLMQCKLTLAIEEGYGRAEHISLVLKETEQNGNADGAPILKALRLKELISKEFSIEKEAIELLIQ